MIVAASLTSNKHPGANSDAGPREGCGPSAACREFRWLSYPLAVVRGSVLSIAARDAVHRCSRRYLSLLAALSIAARGVVYRLH